LRGSHWSKDEEESLRQAWELGQTREACISAFEGRRSARSVEEKLKRLGIYVRRTPGIEKIRAAHQARLQPLIPSVREAYKSLGSLLKTALATGVSERVVRHVCRDLVQEKIKTYGDRERDKVRRRIAGAYRRDNPGVLSIKEQWYLINKLIDITLEGGDGREVARQLRQNYLEGQRVAERMRHLPVRRDGVIETGDRLMGLGGPLAGEGAVPAVPRGCVEGAGGLVR